MTVQDSVQQVASAPAAVKPAVQEAPAVKAGGEKPADGAQDGKVLGVVGITINAMALIAPGAFLWVTFGVQAASESSSGESYAEDMWPGIIFALIVAFSTAFPYAELARRYPEADCGGAYYFADIGFKETLLGDGVKQWGRTGKLFIGWSSHLFYWVYPGVMTAFQATLIGYIIKQVTNSEDDFPTAVYPLFCALMSAGVGFFCYLGVTGSTAVAILINVVQSSMLVILSAFFFHFRFSNPLNLADNEWVYESSFDVIYPKSLVGVLFQASIAILILVGFDSATSLSGDSINPSRDIPRGVIASITIQGCFAYVLEYWAANAALNHRFMSTTDDGVVTGMSAAAASDAPIGDLSMFVIQAVCGSGGKAFMVVLSMTVAMAVFGSTLAAMNTAVRFSQAMAMDGEFPEMFGKLSSKGTPAKGIMVCVVWTFLVGSVGSVGGVMTLTAVTLASNIGTFCLYGAVCIVTIVAFKNTPNEKKGMQFVMPIIGLFLNVLMIGSIFIIGLMAGGDTTTAVIIALCLASVWAGLSVPYWRMNAPTRVTCIGEVKSVVPAAP